VGGAPEGVTNRSPIRIMFFFFFFFIQSFKHTPALNPLTKSSYLCNSFVHSLNAPASASAPGSTSPEAPGHERAIAAPGRGRQPTRPRRVSWLRGIVGPRASRRGEPGRRGGCRGEEEGEARGPVVVARAGGRHPGAHDGAVHLCADAGGRADVGHGGPACLAGA